MAYEEKQQQTGKAHSISMEDRAKLNVTGVEDVESFDENTIVIDVYKRQVYSCTAGKTDDLITVSVCANGFLYNMCRAIVGTLVYASYGKIEPGDIPKLLELGDRRLTGPTMPPQGLYLNRVWYEGPAGIMMLKD